MSSKFHYKSFFRCKFRSIFRHYLHDCLQHSLKRQDKWKGQVEKAQDFSLFSCANLYIFQTLTYKKSNIYFNHIKSRKADKRKSPLKKIYIYVYIFITKTSFESIDYETDFKIPNSFKVQYFRSYTDRFLKK